MDGVTYVDDSKATTLAAMAGGLKMSRGRVRLICGGLLKEHDLDEFKKVLAERVSGLYLIGRASEEDLPCLVGEVLCFQCGTLEDALRRAHRDASTGETVLLSPGCASFDQFRNYADRGERFKELVSNLTGETIIISKFNRSRWAGMGSKFMQFVKDKNGKVRPPALVALVICLHAVVVGSILFAQGCGTIHPRQQSVEAPLSR